MTSRELIDVNSVFKGPFWRLFQEFVEERKKDHLKTVDGQVSGFGDFFERERSIGARIELTELLERFPVHVQTLFDEAVKKEK